MLDQLIITSLLKPLFLEVAVDVVAVATLAPLAVLLDGHSLMIWTPLMFSICSLLRLSPHFW